MHPLSSSESKTSAEVVRAKQSVVLDDAQFQHVLTKFNIHPMAIFPMNGMCARAIQSRTDGMKRSMWK
jgi:hypothetical protein